jgi:ankyrin repeat protein
MPINSHGSTAAHLAAWKDYAECLRVLQSGCYNCGFLDDSFISEEWIAQSSASCENDEVNEKGYDAVLDRCGASTSIFAVPLGDIKTWAADWNIINTKGETPVHVAAREGSCDAMQFFLDLTISFVEAAAMRNLVSVDVEVVRTHCPSEDGVDIGNNSMDSHHLDKSKLSSSPPVDFSLRNNEGMDCASLAAKNNHACIIKLLGRAIQQIRDIENEKDHGAKRTGRDVFVQNPSSLLSKIPQDRSVTKPLPQSHLSSHLRRRANTDPVGVHIEQRTLNKLSQSEHGLKQLSLPRHYPSLDLRHPHEQNNHEAPIHVAARKGNASVVKALFDSGCCDTPARDSLGQTALHIAVLNSRLEVCQFFAELNFEQFKVRKKFVHMPHLASKSNPTHTCSEFRCCRHPRQDPTLHCMFPWQFINCPHLDTCV